MSNTVVKVTVDIKRYPLRTTIHMYVIMDPLFITDTSPS